MTDIQYSALERPAVGAPESTHGLVTRLVRLPLAILDTLLVWQERDRQRRQLAALDDRQAESSQAEPSQPDPCSPQDAGETNLEPPPACGAFFWLRHSATGFWLRHSATGH